MFVVMMLSQLSERSDTTQQLGEMDCIRHLDHLASAAAHRNNETDSNEAF